MTNNIDDDKKVVQQDVLNCIQPYLTKYQGEKAWQIWQAIGEMQVIQDAVEWAIHKEMEDEYYRENPDLALKQAKEIVARGKRRRRAERSTRARR
jgi:hypothetical protein